jgi:hypothetical protein
LLALSSLPSFFRGFRLPRFDLYDQVGDLSSDRNGISQITDYRWLRLYRAIHQ